MSYQIEIGIPDASDRVRWKQLRAKHGSKDVLLFPDQRTARRFVRKHVFDSMVRLRLADGSTKLIRANYKDVHEQHQESFQSS